MERPPRADLEAARPERAVHQQLRVAESRQRSVLVASAERRQALTSKRGAGDMFISPMTGGCMRGFVQAGFALVAAVVLAAPSAKAQLSSHPTDDFSGQRNDRRGIYLGLAAGGGLQFASGLDAKFGLSAETKIGYSINSRLQLYLAGSFQNATYNVVGLSSQQLILTTAHLHHFLFQDRTGLGVFVDAGVGVGFVSPGVGPTGATAIGLGYSGGIGLEIPLTRYFSLVPEFYYRSVNNASSDSGFQTNINTLGLQFGVVYY
jgi:hypothetical protein